MVPTQALTTSLEETYFSWLCSIVRTGYTEKVEAYKDVLLLLYFKVFPALIPNDDNRAEDGKALRDAFHAQTGLDLDRATYRRPCNVLEMLIAISARMAYTIFNPVEDKEYDTECCFWEIIDNLDLRPDRSDNLQVLEVFLNRVYRVNGRGGLFPLKYPQEDQRNVEIWYQMQAYIAERL